MFMSMQPQDFLHARYVWHKVSPLQFPIKAKDIIYRGEEMKDTTGCLDTNIRDKE